jgi:ABC-type cobalamin/Fe3+-siderophores transport system ATPase subunit
MKTFEMAANEVRLPYFEVTPGTTTISFELPKNKISFLLGANGSGKSTLLKALLGFIKPLSGHCTSQTLSATERAQQIAWIDQSISNDIAYSAAEVVAMSGASHAAIAKAMATLEVAQYADKPLMQLSGGEQRRVHLARALAQSAPWLLLDEPTTHLDIAHELQLLDTLGKLVALDRSVLMATHNPAHVGLVPTEGLGLVLIMDKGQLVFQGDTCDGEQWKPKLCEVLGVTQAQLQSLSRF